MSRSRWSASWATRTATLLGSLWLAGLPGLDAAHAAVFTVTNTDDSGAGSLRQAILDANAALGEDTILFTLPADSVITLATDLADLTEAVTFDATGASGLVVDGDGANRILGTAGADVGWIDLNAEMGDIELGDGDAFTFTANNDGEIAADIHDADLAPTTGGALVKQGTATLVLSGVNDFSGGITIEAGTLVGNVDSLPGDIVNDGALVFAQDADADFLGSISGTGRVEKSGAGILALTQPNTYTGGTLVGEGTLGGDTTSLQGDIEVAAGAIVGFFQGLGGDGEFLDDISGDGALLKIGDGDLLLSGDNSYGGGTFVDAGTITGDTEGIQGDVGLLGGTSLVFEQPANGTMAGSIGGDGSLVKRGAGNLTLSGSNGYSGGTTVEEGTLTGDADAIQGDVDLLNPGTRLVFDQSGAGSFDGVVSGVGDVTKQGSGTLSITAAQTYGGDTTITGGILELTGTGSLASATFVEAGGTLSGTGSISAPVTVRGRVTPGGASLDTLSLGGGVDFLGGSFLVVDMDDANGADLLAVTGAALVDPAATLQILPAPGDYSGGSTVTVLTAGSVTGMFLEGEPFAFLDRTVTYPGGNSVQVTLMSNGANLATIGSTPNQRAVGGALATLVGSPDPDLQELFDNLNTLTASQANPTLDSLSGESLSGLTTARVALGEQMQRMLQRRSRQLLFATDAAWPLRPPRSTSPTRPPRAQRSDVAAPRRLGERGLGGWLDAYGVLGSLDGDGNSADLDYGLFGSTLGLDFRLGDHGLLGVAAGYARTEVEVDDRGARGDADTAQGALYAAWANRIVYAGLSGRYAWSQAESRRDIVAGTLRRKARADFDSHDYGLRGELALRALDARGVQLEPLAGFEWNHLTRDDFDERGAGSLGLSVDSETLDSALLQLGARVHGLFEMNEQSVLAPELRAYWLHEFGDDERRVDARLAGAPFSVTGAEAPRDGALVGAGWSISLGPHVRATADYDLRIDADRVEHVGSVAFRARF